MALPFLLALSADTTGLGYGSDTKPYRNCIFRFVGIFWVKVILRRMYAQTQRGWCVAEVAQGQSIRQNADCWGVFRQLPGSVPFASGSEPPEKLAATQEMQIAELQQELDTTRATQPDEFIEIREISKEKAREEIIESFKSGEPLDHADLADALALEISLVVEVCSELMEEGVVVFYDDDWG